MTLRTLRETFSVGRSPLAEWVFRALFGRTSANGGQRSTTVRATIATLAACLLMAQASAPSPVDLLARGRASYDAGKYDDAIKDLSAAADAMASPAQMQAYVDRGKFEALPQFETAVIYLAMSYAKLGRDADARDQIQRLLAAEAIAPTYATLPLDADVAGFEDLVHRLSPETKLASNAAAAAPGVASPAAGQAKAPAPTQTAEQAKVPAPTSPAPAPPPTPTQTAAAAPAQPAPATSLTPEQQRELDQRIADARAAAEKEAEQKIAAEKAEIEKNMEQQIAAARAAADAQVAAERAAIEKQAEQQIAAIRAAASKEVAQATVPTIRRAEGMALAGDVTDANAMYERLLATPNAPRELVAAVATGFYRTGDYADALRAFEKLGTFARGEEDLRYYRAVSLFETGHYAEAKKELECALPFIEITADVNRYREKIEQMP